MSDALTFMSLFPGRQIHLVNMENMIWYSVNITFNILFKGEKINMRKALNTARLEPRLTSSVSAKGGKFELQWLCVILRQRRTYK